MGENQIILSPLMDGATVAVEENELMSSVAKPLLYYASKMKETNDKMMCPVHSGIGTLAADERKNDIIGGGSMPIVAA